MKDAEPPAMRVLYWFALGTFAIGTEGFMIAPLLPNLAQDLSVSLVAAGQLVTVFTLSYAFSSPILTALTGGIGRRNLLIGSVLAFGAANFLAALATDYWSLMRTSIRHCAVVVAVVEALSVGTIEGASAITVLIDVEVTAATAAAEMRSPSLGRLGARGGWGFDRWMTLR